MHTYDRTLPTKTKTVHTKHVPEDARRFEPTLSTEEVRNQPTKAAEKHWLLLGGKSKAGSDRLKCLSTAFSRQLIEQNGWSKAM